MRNGRLEEFRNMLPVLTEIDDRMLAGIDASEWYLPSADQGRLLEAVSRRHDIHLMTYREGQPAKTGEGLCSRIVAANLNDSALEEIARLETAMPGAIVVAYARPLRQRNCR
jgi:hypothetical protein